MLEAIVHDTALPRVHRWLQRAAGGPVPLVVCNLQGKAVWQDDGADAAELAQAIAGLLGSGFHWPFEGGGLSAHALPAPGLAGHAGAAL